MSLISTAVFPGDAMSPEGIDTAAASLRYVGSEVKTQSGAVDRTWRRLAHVYEAPEAEQLLAAMSPVRTSGSTFDRHLASTAGALTVFAEEVRMIKKALEIIRTEANIFLAGISDGMITKVVAFRGDPRGSEQVPWGDDPTAVLTNNALLARVNEQQVRLWAAERTCANTIAGLVGGPQVTAASAATCGRGYGVDAIAPGSDLPWGAAEPVPERCQDAVARGAGMAAIGAVVGIAGLAGVRNPTSDPEYVWEHAIDPSQTTWSAADAATAWGQVGTLVTGVAGEELALSWLPGPVGGFFRRAEGSYDQLKRDLFAVDQWSSDPGGAVGTVAFNLATLDLGATGLVRTGARLEPSLLVAARESVAPLPRVLHAHGGHGSVMDEFGSDVGPVSKRNYRADQAGGPILSLTTDHIKITQDGMAVVERHLARFGFSERNVPMLERLHAIVEGKLSPTRIDKNFYAHELRESVRYRKIGYELGVSPSDADGYDIWNDLHTATLEDFRIKDGTGYLYID